MAEVRIGLPIYNVEPFLEACLSSIKAQSFADFEVVAVLDACTDRSEEILRDCADERFTILNNERNSGRAYTTNRTLEGIQTPLYAIMDSDDMMVETRLEKQVAFLKEHPEIDVVGSWSQYIDEKGKRLDKFDRFATEPEEIREQFRSFNAMSHPTCMLRTARIREIGGYSSAYRASEDLLLFMMLLAHGCRLANLPEVLHLYRIWGGQSTTSNHERMLELNDIIYRDWGPKIWGERAPNFVGGRTRLQRMRRRLKYLLKGFPEGPLAEK